jgi:hypothetical protein
MADRHVTGQVFRTFQDLWECLSKAMTCIKFTNACGLSHTCSVERRPGSVGIAAGRTPCEHVAAVDGYRMPVLAAILRADLIRCVSDDGAIGVIAFPLNGLPAGHFFQSPVFGFQCARAVARGKFRTAATDDTALQGGNVTCRCRGFWRQKSTRSCRGTGRGGTSGNDGYTAKGQQHG